MILCINYADEKFRPWQQLQTQTAYYFGADKVREYSPKDIPPDFYAKNKFILDQPRGAGYWLWKPLIIKDALAGVDFGDYVFYVDSGAFYVHDMHALIDAMERAKTDVMSFESAYFEREATWSKRDAFILMDCDDEKFAESVQRASGFIVLKKSPASVALIDEFLEYAQDPRIITDMPNQLGMENYAGFWENRHDQTIWSLLTKKNNLPSFRFPSQHSEQVPSSAYPADVVARSPYPTMFYLHHRNVGFDRTLSDFLRIYGNEPRLCEGVRTAKYLIQEGMVNEAYEVLWRLLQKYRDGNDDAWSNIWDDVLYIIFKHKDIGAPYAETFQPLMCKFLLEIIKRKIAYDKVPILLYVAECVENKELLPKDFQNTLALFVAEYVRFVRNLTPPRAYPFDAQDVLNIYRRLNLPETPQLKDV